MSKPVRCASSNSVGGFQYSGTNKGSVRPSKLVAALTSIIWRRNPICAMYNSAQGTRNALAQKNQT